MVCVGVDSKYLSNYFVLTKIGVTSGIDHARIDVTAMEKYMFAVLDHPTLKYTER